MHTNIGSDREFYILEKGVSVCLVILCVKGSRAVSLYKLCSDGLINVVYIDRRDFLFRANLNELIRFFLCHALFLMDSIWLCQEHELETFKPRCL